MNYIATLKALHVVELERLAQLIDLPIFSFARDQVLTPQQHAHLVKVWYGARFSTEIYNRGCHWFPHLLT
jgi:hypothetical protein